MSRPPICVLPKTYNGLSAIAVWVEGGGIEPGYMAELHFNGTAYPINPTAPPAQPLQKSECEIIIPSARNAEALF